MIGWVVFFFLAGMVLIMAEFFLPGLICGVIGGIFLVVSCTIALYAKPDYAFFIILGESMAAVIFIGLGFYFIPRSVIGKAMILETSQPLDSGWVSDESDDSLVGALGEVFTALRPAGTVMINGRRINAVSTGEFIGDGTAVRVIEVHGNRVVVEPAGSSAAHTAN